jgi:hypothetical protein
MAYSFSERLDKLGARRKELDFESVTIRRDLVGTPDVEASLSRMEAAEYSAGGVTQHNFIVFTFDVADYAFSGVASLPNHGDEIERSNGEIYRVVSMGDSPPFSYTTSTKKRISVVAQHFE